MIIYLLALIVLIILVWTIIVHTPKKQEKVLLYTGISKTTQPDVRPTFNTWMRYIRFKNYQSR